MRNPLAVLGFSFQNAGGRLFINFLAGSRVDSPSELLIADGLVCVEKREQCSDLFRGQRASIVKPGQFAH